MQAGKAFAQAPESPDDLKETIESEGEEESETAGTVKEEIIKAIFICLFFVFTYCKLSSVLLFSLFDAQVT